jgi:acyl-coenzyme A thioesterase PaaI-like protein
MITIRGNNDRCLRIPASREERQEWERRLCEMPVMKHLGAELDLQDPYIVRLHLRHPSDAHYGGLGTKALNGAMIAGMMDCAMSVAGILHFRGRTCGTLHMSVDFMKPVRSRYPTVECRAVRKSPNVIFLEAQLIECGKRSSVSASGIVGVSGLKQSQNTDAENANWLMPFGSVGEMSGDADNDASEFESA